MNYFICAVIAAAAIVFAVSKFFLSSAVWAKRDKIISLALGGAGLLSFVVFLVITLVKLHVANETKTPDYGDWASGVISGYFKDVLPVFGIVVLLVVLSGVFQPSKYPLRAIVISIASILLLVYGELAAYFASGGNVPLETVIREMSYSLSVFMFGFGYFDYKYLASKLKQ